MSEPAYLKNLKNYSRTQFGDRDMSEAATVELENESIRGALILAATSIEDTLEYAIGLRMTILEEDAAARKKVFGSDGIVATYSSKILMAYALGIIDKQARDQIDLVREIRNACAHCRLPINLGVPALVEAVKKAIGDQMLNEIKDHKPETLRMAFICQCAVLSAYVATGVRRSPLETLEAFLKGEVIVEPPP